MTFSPDQKKLLSYLALSDFVQLHNWQKQTWLLLDSASSITGPVFSATEVNPLIAEGILEMVSEHRHAYWISNKGWRAMHEQGIEPYEGNRESWMLTACPDAVSKLDEIGLKLGMAMPKSRRFIGKRVDDCLREIVAWREHWRKMATELAMTGSLSRETVETVGQFFVTTQELDFPFPLPKKEKSNV